MADLDERVYACARFATRHASGSRATPTAHEALSSAPRHRRCPTCRLGRPWPTAREALITAPHGRPRRRNVLPHTRRAQVAQTAPRDARQGRPAGRTRGADHSASWPARRDRTAQGTGRASTARTPRPMDATAQSVAGSSGRRCSQRLAADAAHRAAATGRSAEEKNPRGTRARRKAAPTQEMKHGRTPRARARNNRRDKVRAAAAQGVAGRSGGAVISASQPTPPDTPTAAPRRPHERR